MKRTRKPDIPQKNKSNLKKSNSKKTVSGSPERNLKKNIIGFAVAFSVLIGNFLFMFPDQATSIQLSLNKNLFIFINIILSGIIFLGIYKSEKAYTENIIKYTFLLLLIFSISISFIYPKEYSDNFIRLYFKLLTFQSFFTIPAIALGIISLWKNKSKLQEIINKLFGEKEKSDKIQSLKNKLITPIANLFSKKEILYTIGFFAIIGLSIFTLFYKLDYFDLYSDEAQVTMGAASYYHSGEYKYWDFAKEKIINQKYERARPHLFLVALSYDIFGISTWSSRFPSALFGVLLIIFSFFIARYFIKDKLAVLLIIFSFAFYFEFLLLQRWTRMYAILFPSYLLATYFGYKFLVEKNTILKFPFLKNKIFSEYLNFNYIFLPLLLLLLYINLELHPNSTYLMPVLLLFSIFVIIFSKERKYIVVSVLGILLVIYQILFPYKVGFNWFTFFEVDNSKFYNKFLFGYPFSLNTNIILVSIATASFFFIKNNFFRKKYLILLLTGLLAWILFSFVIKYSVSFRYISHLTPLIIFLIIGSYILISKTLYNKIIQTILSLLLVVFVLLHFNSRYDDLYVKNFAAPAKTRVAYKTMIDNYKKGEIIYRHWGPLFYYKGIDTSAIFFDISHKKLKTVFSTINNHKAGWLVWSSHNQYAMDSAVVSYANTYFKKYHGYGVDKTNVELFYYTDSMLVDTNNLKKDMTFPNANMNLHNSYSISFWLQINKQNLNPPFLFRKNDRDIFTIVPDTVNNTLLCSYDEKNICTTSQVVDNNWHHIVWYQEGGKKGDRYGFFIDGKKSNSKELQTEISGLVKFYFNKQFRGGIDDIRIYDFVLNIGQINTIMKVKGVKKTEELFVGKKKFKTLFHWQKQ